jgi:hypothetical protein
VCIDESFLPDIVVLYLDDMGESNRAVVQGKVFESRWVMVEFGMESVFSGGYGILERDCGL